jgi:hypothetical protein
MPRVVLLTALMSTACGIFEVTPTMRSDAGIPSTLLDGGPGECGNSVLLTYALNGTFEITDTTAGIGDTERPITPGEITLRVSADTEGTARTAIIVALSYGQQFEITSFGIRTIANITSTAGPNVCGLAHGTLEGNTLTWNRCTPSPNQGVDKNSWTPNDPAEGPGCLSDLRSSGSVHCEGPMCDIGGLVEGENPESNRYDLPLQAFVFSEDMSQFTMSRTELPNVTPSRTWVSFTGTQKTSYLSAVPGCLCEH